MACCLVRMLWVEKREKFTLSEFLSWMVAVEGGGAFTHCNGTNSKREEIEDNEVKEKLRRKLDCWCKFRLPQKRNLQSSTGLS